jgi:hypothetical protein
VPLTGGRDNSSCCPPRTQDDEAGAGQVRTKELSGRCLKSSDIGVVTMKPSIVEPEGVDSSDLFGQHGQLIAGIVYQDFKRNRDVSPAIYRAELIQRLP